MPVDTASPLRRRTRARKAVVAGFATVGAVTLACTALTGTAHAQAKADAEKPKQIAKKIIDNKAQYRCFSKIVEHESDWDHTARNASGAYGLVQALPGSKMASAGSDWRTNPATQIEWGVDYMKDRYGSPCGAWSFWQQNSWY